MKTNLSRQNHYSPDFRQLDSMLDALKGFLHAAVEPEDPAWKADFEGIVAFQDNDGSFRMLDSDRVEADARVDYCYMPTYVCAAIIMKAYMTDEDILDGKESVLERALRACCNRKLRGHGYECLKGQLEALNIFAQGGVREFMLYHTDICPEFTNMMTEIVTELRHKIVSGATSSAWGEDYAETIEQLVDYFSHSLAFVYGTLMAGESNHNYYLRNRECIGKASVTGFDMYDIGSFPGIVPGAGVVKGELYEITDEDLENFDYLEGEGDLYIRKCVPAAADSGEVLFAHVYEYNYAVSDLELIPEYLQPYSADWKNRRDNYVWYVSYGSNMLKDRFLCYIRGGSFRGSRPLEACEDKSDPISIRPYDIPHDMYFGKESHSWADKGVSFLDITKPGRAYGVAYLITREQYDHVARQEIGGIEPEYSTWYNCRYSLGYMDGIEVLTLTNGGIVEPNEPGEIYLGVLEEGLGESYSELSDEEIRNYIESSKKYPRG